MQSHATEEQVREVCKRIESLGLKAHPCLGRCARRSASPGTKALLIWASLNPFRRRRVIPVSKPYKLVSRDTKEEDTILRIPTPSGDVIVGGEHIALVAGPCAVETEEQCLAIAERVKKSGARLFRGGAYKPRTSPYSFQGLGEEGLKIFRKFAPHTDSGSLPRQSTMNRSILSRICRRHPDRRAATCRIFLC